MTTIVYDGVTIATDTQSSSHFRHQGPCQKVFLNRDGSKALCIAGQYNWPAVRAEFILKEFPKILVSNWYEEKVLDIPSHAEFDLLLIDRDKCYFASGDLEFTEVPSPYAIGSGSEYALGAVAAGATAEEAIVIASRFDLFTNNDMKSYELAYD